MEEKVEWDQGLDQHMVPAIRQPKFAHHVQINPKQRLQSSISSTRGAQLVLHGTPWVYMCGHCHQIITWPNGPRDPQGSPEKSYFSAIRFRPFSL